MRTEREVIRRRVAETLLDPEAMEALVEASGGLLGTSSWP